MVPIEHSEKAISVVIMFSHLQLLLSKWFKCRDNTINKLIHVIEHEIRSDYGEKCELLSKYRYVIISVAHQSEGDKKPIEIQT